MTDIIDPLVRDLVEWIAREPRAQRDVLDAWRTSCPRLMVWETALERGFVERKLLEGQGAFVFATDAGRRFVRDYGKRPVRAARAADIMTRAAA
ncbi:MAG: hypothetical protein JSR61_20560 [Proteobacteria bacterium]|nr:hypothetical protein [Pseudomonadota bacterium]